jgi:tetratricopeptide (TPR) repeat protein
LGIFLQQREEHVTKQWSTSIGAKALFILVVAGIQGCSSGREATRQPAGSGVVARPAPDALRDLALRHFIDGSLYEVKGEYAQAVLEYQDALRYEKNDAIYLALARDYSQLGKHSLAIEAGKEAVRLNPENLEYRRLLAEIYAAAFELDAAATEYEEVTKRDSTDIEAWYNLARLYQMRRPLKALELYERMIDRFGNEWDVLLQMAELYNSMGQFDKAAGALKRMSSLDPSNIELKRSVGQTLVRAQKYDEAEKIYQELQELNPGNLDYRRELASLYLMKKEYAKASALFDTILSRDSVSLDGKLRIGEIYFSQIEKDSSVTPIAQSFFERIIKSHPEDWRAYWFLGAIGAISHDDSLALHNFRKVTELASWNADGWVYLSSVFLEKNNYQEVATILESAYKVLPDDFRVNLYLGVAYSRLGRNPDAARVLERARTLNPKDVGAITQLALVYDAMKRYEDSDKLYEEGLAIDPQNHLILNNYGYSLADRGLQLERALEMSKKALEAQANNASYLDTMGWVYYRLGKLKDAEAYVKRAIEKGEVSAVVYEHLGDIYYAMNDRDRALEQWKIALKLDEHNTALREKISRGSL